MEANVWIASFVRAANSLSSLFASWKNPSVASNGGELPAAHASDAASISTLRNMIVTRNPKLITSDGVFGTMTYNSEFICDTVENKAKMILPGTYTAKLDASPRLGYVCPHIAVPERDKAAGGDAGIRIHILNEPCQSDGCIGVGTAVDGDAVDTSRVAFDLMMSKLPPSFTVTIL